MADTTSLNDLPIDNNSSSAPIQQVVQGQPNTLPTNQQMQQLQQQQSQQGNITLETSEIQPQNVKQANPPQYVPPDQERAPPEPLSQNMISQLVSGLQQASKTGETQLPSRDIPVNPSHITQDEQVKPNFVPSSPPDYIQKYETQNEMQTQHLQNQKQENQLDRLYNEIQSPLMIGVLFFMFQLPFFQKFIKKNLPMLYLQDGNITMSGYIFKAFLFSISYYGLQRAMRQLSESV